MPLLLKLASYQGESPMRFGIYDEGHLLMTISLETKKTFLKNEFVDADHSCEISLTDETLTEIENQEFDFLKLTMCQYLAHREIAPKKLSEWLDKRKLNRTTKNKLLKLAEENNFLSPERFIRYWVEKRFSEGKKPWWILEREVRELVILGDEPDAKLASIDHLLEELKYSDLTLLNQNSTLIQQLKKTLRADRPQSEKLEKFKNKLLSRGFSYTVIQKWIDGEIDKIKRSSETSEADHD